jgi:hypothetical protein
LPVAFSFRFHFVLVQPGGARGICQCFDATVVKVTTAIEDYLIDPFRQRSFGNRLTDAPRRV